MAIQTPLPIRPQKLRVLVLGATGTIGRATVPAIAGRGHEVVCLVRAGSKITAPAGVTVRHGDVRDPQSFRRDGFAGEKFDAIVSCLASRTGAPVDAWAIDHGANLNALEAAKEAGVKHFVLLSAICVQRPLLEFQKAKLAFERALMQSGLDFTIVRPTAFFKSLSGQVDRVKAGRPFLVFGDGKLTSCKPISDCDLGNFIASCLDDPVRRNRILPVGGPGEAITPLDQADGLSRLLGREVKVRRVPVAMLDAIIAGLSLAGLVSKTAAEKAELARIGRYYATQSMLVLDPATGQYDAQSTPSFGSDTLFDYYGQLVRGEATAERGEHAVF